MTEYNLQKFLVQQLSCQTKLGKVNAKPRHKISCFKYRYHPRHAILRQGRRHLTKEAKKQKKDKGIEYCV